MSNTKLATKTIRYLSTIGIKVWSEKSQKSFLGKVCFAIQDDEQTVIATVENALNLNTLNSYGKIKITRDQFREMPHDPYNNLIFAEAAFDLFNLQICGRNTDNDE